MDVVYEQVIKNLDDMGKYVIRNMSEYGTTFQTEQLSPYDNYIETFNTHIPSEILPDDEIKKLFDRVDM